MGAPPFVVSTLPWVELALGGLLIAQVARRVAAVAAIALLVAFTTVIVRRLRAGEHPPCACFGAWSTRPLSAGHVARNCVLLALCVVALW